MFRRLLPQLRQREVEIPEEHHGEWRWQMGASLLCLSSAVAAHIPWVGSLAPWAFGAAYFFGSYYTAQETWQRMREGGLNVHFLMLAVAAGAASLGNWAEGSALLFLFSFSGALERFAMERTQREIRALLKAAPKTATVLDPSGAESVVPVDDLGKGMRILVRPGELFPVDAEVVKGETACDESTLTGEAAPVGKQVGDPLSSGTLNLWGSVEALVLRPAQQSALQNVIRLIQSAQRNKAPSQRLTDRFGTSYTYAILGLTAAMFLVWWLALHHAPFAAQPGEPSAFYHAMTLLVVASPCALVLSIPSAILAAIASGARHGILFRGGAAVEKLAEIQAVVMDKTGTLTTGEMHVDVVESFPPGREHEVLRLACALESQSSHPLARAVVRHGRRQGVQPVDLTEITSLAGFGMRASIGALELRVGRRTWVAPDSAAADPETHGVSEVWVSHGTLIGRLILRDEIRPEAPRLIAALHALGLRALVLTGDRAAAAAHLQSTLGLDDVRGELTPAQKLDAIRDLGANGCRAAMIGDGINDAPSIAAAHVGVAMGARGSDAALEQADVVLMHDRLENFLGAYALSGTARRIIRQNLAISLGVIVILVLLASLQKLTLSLGVLGHEGSTAVVVLNSLRLFRAPASLTPKKAAGVIPSAMR